MKPGQSSDSTRHRHAEEDAAAGTFRDHRTHARRGCGLDRAGAPRAGTVPISQQDFRLISSLNSPVLSVARVVGGIHRTQPRGLRHPFIAAHQGNADLSAHPRNLRAVQLLLGHRKLENTVRYLGIEVNDALEIAEQTEV